MELAHNSLLPLLNITEAQNKTAYTYPVITLVLSITSSSVSILGGTVIILTYITLPEIRNFTRKLVVSLTVADLLTAIGIWVSVIRYFNLHGEFVRNHHMEDTLCKIQSFLTTLSSLVSFFLTSIIAVYIFDTVIHQKDRLNKRRWLIAFNLISWIIPGCIVIVAMTYDVLGGDATPTAATGPWCWIAENAKNGTMWRFVTGKGWEISCYLITTSLYVLLKFHIYIRHRYRTFHTICVTLRDEDKNFLYVWLVLYVLRLWGTLRFFLRIGLHPSTEEDYMDALLYMQALGDPAQSFCNFLLFCIFDKTVRTRMIQRILRRQEETDNEQSIQLLDSGTHQTPENGYGTTDSF